MSRDAALPVKSYSLSESATQGAPWLVLAKLILFFVYFAISVLMVRTLGPQQYGLYSICRNIVEYALVLAGLGLNAALIRYIPELCVHHNRVGLIRLLTRASLLQFAACVCVSVLLVVFQPQLEAIFGVDFSWLLVICGLLLLALLAKDLTNDAQTALFQSRQVALFSIVQGVVWLVLVGWAAFSGGGVDVMLAAQAIATLIASGAAAFFLVRSIRQLNWRSPDQGIGRSRVLRLALPTLGNNLARALMLKYTEVFFLGAFFGATAAGVYDLGYTIPFLVITFIPMAVQTLMAASMHEAYSRDPECLPSLVSMMYKMLILLAVPLAAFGVFFAPRGIELIYGSEMRAAGPVASAFCVLHILPLISLPLSMAIQAREKVHNMLPLMLLQVVVNIALDILLIPAFGIPGAVAAVFLTFALTIPLRLRQVARLVGGIWFPGWFLTRIALPCVSLAGLFYLAIPAPSLLILIVLSFLYLALVAAGIRFSLLLSTEDKDIFRSMVSGKAARFMQLLLGPSSSTTPTA